MTQDAFHPRRAAGAQLLASGALAGALLALGAPAMAFDKAPTKVAVATPPATFETKVAGNKVPQEKRSDPGLYVTAEEAALLTTIHSDYVLVDIRSRAEVAFLGMPTAAAKNIPYMEPDSGWEFDAKKGEYKLEINPDFAVALERLLASKNLGKSAPILLLCRSGTRSAKAASYLAKLGYRYVYSVVDGYEGDKSKAGRRDVNGWKNAGLAWSYKLPPEKRYDSPSF